MARLEEVKKILRSLLVSAPVKVTVSSLNRDYKSLEGYNIPHRELGYNSLIHLLHSIPDVLRVNGSSFESEVTLVINDKVAHVSDMVMKQKKPSKGKLARAGRKSVIRENSFDKSYNANSPRSSHKIECDKTKKTSPVFHSKNIALSPFPKPVMPNQIKLPELRRHIQNDIPKIESNNVNNSYEFDDDESDSSEYVSNIIESVPFSAHSTPNCDRVPSLSKHTPQNILKEDKSMDKENLESPSSKFERLKLNRLKNKSDLPKTDLKTVLTNGLVGTSGIISLEVDRDKIPSDVQNRLKRLIKLHPSGIQCTQLLSLYKRHYYKSLDYEKYGFDRLISLCLYLNNIFHCEPESDCDYRLYDKDNIPLNRVEKIKESSNKIESKIVAKTVDLSKIKAVKSKDWDNFSDLIPRDCLELGEIVENNSLTEYPIGETIQIVISEIYNPNKFWIYRNNNSLLNDMMNLMQDFYRENKVKYLVPEILLDVGLYCVVNTLNEFQRALVVDLLNELGGYVKVYLIDYGTLANLSRDKVWFLCKEFSSLPSQAVETNLAGIEPKENIWTERSITRFKDMVTSKQIFAKILDKKEQVLSVHISVMKMPLKTINDFLVQEGYAKYTEDSETPVNTSNDSPSDEMNPRRKLIEKLRLKNKMK